MSHHRTVSDAKKASLANLFNSDQKEFEDGDVLFVGHRMRLKCGVGPRFKLPKLREYAKPKEITMSISKYGFNLWSDGHSIRNALSFASSFLFEHVMIVINDVVVALMGQNYFFPNKPRSFHK